MCYTTNYLGYMTRWGGSCEEQLDGYVSWFDEFIPHESRPFDVEVLEVHTKEFPVMAALSADWEAISSIFLSDDESLVVLFIMFHNYLWGISDEVGGIEDGWFRRCNVSICSRMDELI